jgi:acyl-CoA reductase-like NAD-dependent aldehyde dehydrogenase
MSVRESTDAEIAEACEAAAQAADTLAWAPNATIALLLEAAAGELEQVGSDLVRVADEETALGEVRLEGELARTCGQLRAFAGLVSSGSHAEPIISMATESTPDLRRMMVPVGPVAVFGASNFPLAFSVPGGDTASALAAGCPVVAKGHPSHPRTSELCAEAITLAVKAAGLPEGAFAMVQGSSPRVGQVLVEAPEIRAVGFTGSHHAGRALYELAARRPVPIPVYAEMGSLNPVLVTAAAIESRAPSIAAELAASITLGCGQFCTKPGLIFSPPSEAFSLELSEAMGKVAPSRMLNEGIADSFTRAVERTMSLDGLEVLAGKPGPGRPLLLSTTLDSFLQRPELVEEHFGPASILVGCPEDRMGEALGRVEGTLATSVYAETSDDDLVRGLIPELVRRSGRIIFDGPPTGVAVVPAMVHGGPYPATTFPSHTSVGLSAIRRFQRPVAFQNAPTRLLPNALQEDPE